MNSLESSKSLLHLTQDFLRRYSDVLLCGGIFFSIILLDRYASTINRVINEYDADRLRMVASVSMLGFFSLAIFLWVLQYFFPAHARVTRLLSTVFSGIALFWAVLLGYMFC